MDEDPPFPSDDASGFDGSASDPFDPFHDGPELPDGGAGEDGDGPFDADADDGPWVPCTLAQILASDPPAETYVVVLRELGGERAFPIHIGGCEWQAIHRPIHGLATPRPMTHDLLLACLAALDASVAMVRVTDLVEDEAGNGTFFGGLVVERGDGFMEIDCRPSDALALAARIDCPILVAEKVLRRMTGDAAEPDGAED